MTPSTSIRRRLRRTAAVLAAPAIALVALAGGPVGATAVPYSGESRTVKVGVLRQPHLSHPLFYDPFLPDNLDLEVVPFATSTEIKNAVVGGDLQFGVTGITSALQGAATGEPVVVVAAAADGGSAIVARAGSGIETVADLAGKRIGFVPASAQDILLRLTLLDAGLDPQTDVDLLNVGFADMANALGGGAIDAFAGAETGPSDAIVRGDGVLVVHPYDTAMGRINIALVTNQDTIDGDAELVQALVAVHARATEYMDAHRDEWVNEVVSEYGFPEESLRMAVDNIFLTWEIDDAYVSAVEVLGAEQLGLDQIEAEPDYARFIDTTFVAALDDQLAGAG